MALLLAPSALEQPTATETQDITWLRQLCEAGGEAELTSNQAKRFAAILRMLLRLRDDAGIRANRILLDERVRSLLSAWIETMDNHFLPLIKPDARRAAAAP